MWWMRGERGARVQVFATPKWHARGRQVMSEFLQACYCVLNFRIQFFLRVILQRSEHNSLRIFHALPARVLRPYTIKLRRTKRSRWS